MQEYNYSISIPSDPKQLPRLREWIASIGTKSGITFNRTVRSALTISLVEAVDNAIFHAHKGDSKKKVDISLTINSTSLLLKVCDSGKGIKKFPSELVLEDEEHGRGLYIIKHLMTDVKSKINNNKHELIMRYSF